MISLDTLRRDRLDVYGSERATSLNLEGLARRSVVFEDARAQSAQTAPSHASLFTAEHPAVHGVINVHGNDPRIHKLPEGVRTVAEVLSEAGLETAAFVSGGNLSKRMDMDRGFDVWDERLEDVSGRIDAALAWMFAPQRGDRGFFALIHTYEVHAPYLPPREVYPAFVDPAYAGPLRARLEKYLSSSTKDAWDAAVGPEYWEGMLDFDDDDVRFLSDLYDAEIAHTDSELRRLFEYVMRSDLSRNTAIIVLSDHGEEFRDHGKYQHDQVFDELLRVPLMIRFPPALESAGYKGRIAEPVGLVDVGPTVADMLGVSWPEEERWGQSLLPLVDKSRPGTWRRRPVFAQLVVDPGPKTHRSVVWDGWKYIHVHQANIDRTWEWLFHVAADPLERKNLVESSDPEPVKVLRVLREMLKNHAVESERRVAAVGKGGISEIDDETEDQMRALGYIGDPDDDEMHEDDVSGDPSGGGGVEDVPHEPTPPQSQAGDDESAQPADQPPGG